MPPSAFQYIITFTQRKDWNALSWLELDSALLSGLLFFRTGAPMLCVVLTLIVTHLSRNLRFSRIVPERLDR
jgi:hypothetical protein